MFLALVIRPLTTDAVRDGAPSLVVVKTLATFAEGADTAHPSTTLWWFHETGAVYSLTRREKMCPGVPIAQPDSSLR